MSEMCKVMTPQEYAVLTKASLLRRFKECMRRQFKAHIESGRGLTQHELRDVARTFAMGWSEAMHATGDVGRTHAWGLAFGEITTEDWWPSDEWRFW